MKQGLEKFFVFFTENCSLKLQWKAEIRVYRGYFAAPKAPRNIFDLLRTRYLGIFFQSEGGELQDLGRGGGEGLQGPRGKVVVKNPGERGRSSVPKAENFFPRECCECKFQTEKRVGKTA